MIKNIEQVGKMKDMILWLLVLAHPGNHVRSEQHNWVEKVAVV
jgi:hypothetical protein